MENLERKPGQSLVFINPKIIEESGFQIGWESCFSLPGHIYRTNRPFEITIEALDEDGKKLTFKTTLF
ncbi:MAG: peptide deformylase [Oscillospiraceae bacterium]